MSLPIPPGERTIPLVTPAGARVNENKDLSTGKCYYNNILHKCNHTTPHPTFPRVTHTKECAGVPLGNVRCQTFTSSAKLYRVDHDCDACIKKARDFELYIGHHLSHATNRGSPAPAVVSSPTTAPATFASLFGKDPEEAIGANGKAFPTFRSFHAALMDEDRKEAEKSKKMQEDKERLAALQLRQDAARREVNMYANIRPFFGPAATFRLSSASAPANFGTANVAKNPYTPIAQLAPASEKKLTGDFHWKYTSGGGGVLPQKPADARGPVARGPEKIAKDDKVKDNAKDIAGDDGEGEWEDVREPKDGEWIIF